MLVDIFKLKIFKNCSKNHLTAKILHTFSEKQNNNTSQTFIVKVLTKYTIMNYNNFKGDVLDEFSRQTHLIKKKEIFL